MKRNDLERHLREQKCTLLREGAKHSVYLNPANGLMTTIPRHTEILTYLARKICKDLE